MANAPAAPVRYRGEIRLLLQAALAIFVVTVAIGILNGLDLVEFNRPTLLTHVHAGTLGWITLAVLAATFWLFEDEKPSAKRSGEARWLSILSIVVIAAYVSAFYLGNLRLRVVAGTLTLLLTAWFFVWLMRRADFRRLTVSQLGLFGAIASLVIGAVMGVLLGIRLAGNPSIPEGIGGAHPTAMVVGYLILAGMAITEWRLRPAPALARRDRPGVLQVALPFLGGLALSVGALLNNFALITLNVPLEIVGVVIYLWRVGPLAVRVPWLGRDNARLFAVSMAFLVANVGLLTYLIIGFVSGKYAKIELIPPWLVFALDHAMFIGVMTNGLMGLTWEMTRDQRGLLSWADDVLFWGMNIGVLGFVVGLVTQETALTRTFSPIMGASILLAIVALTLRLQVRRPAGSETGTRAKTGVAGAG